MPALNASKPATREPGYAFETFERQTAIQLARTLAGGGFDPAPEHANGSKWSLAAQLRIRPIRCSTESAGRASAAPRGDGSANCDRQQPVQARPRPPTSQSTEAYRPVNGFSVTDIFFGENPTNCSFVAVNFTARCYPDAFLAQPSSDQSIIIGGSRLRITSL
jgi:hypothetical protein